MEVGDDDESIEAYMSQLLARVRNGDTEASPVQRERAVMKPTWKPTPEEAETPEVDASGEPLEYLPRSQAPELNSKLSAMRELANDSARSHIATHAKKSGSDFVLAKIIGAAGALGGAAALAYYGNEHPVLTFLGVSTGLGTAAFWVWQALVLKRNASVVVRKVTPESIEAANQATARAESLRTESLSNAEVSA